MRYVLEEKFQIVKGKEKVILDFLPALKKTIEELGGKWLGCYITALGEGEADEYQMLFGFEALGWLQTLFDKVDHVAGSKEWDEFTYNRGNKILKLRY
jgi:hypothetical protein